ncbi:hypothetical protein [Nitratireductor sp. GCM10026969]|uniref:hypothetical protein n=1 Tax=Nitratireductor sp. GCM10026969 TaxID=3252645 RepID=UPI00360BC36C
MLILGLDPSQQCGYALYDTTANISAIRCGVLRAKGDFYEAKAADLARQLVKLIKTERPGFVAMEMPLRMQPGGKARKTKFMGEDVEEEQPKGSGINAVISSNQMVGSLIGIVGAYGLPFEIMSPSNWRKAAYGFGTRPGWGRADWKKHARQKCSQVRITVTNDDMAEACWIAFAGASSQTFKMISQRTAEVA